MFLLSVLFLVIIGVLVANRFAQSAAARFWIFLATAVFQIGGIAVGLSVFSQLAAIPWMVVHGLMALIVMWWLRGSFPSWPKRGESDPWNGVELALAFVIAAVAILTFAMQWVTPIFEGDEKMYHASRVLYWMTNKSIAPYPTHNDRQTVFQFGSELFFLWPVLLTRSEWVARSVFWLGVPLAMVGQWLLLGAMRVSRVVSLGTVLLVMTTPLVTLYAPMLKPEMWSIVFFCGLLWWAMKIAASKDNHAGDYFWLGVYLVLCLNIRSIEVVLLAPLTLLVWGRSAVTKGRKLVGPFVAGIVLTLFLSGALVPLAFNSLNSGNPLGPQEMRRFHASKLSAQQVETHVERFLLNLIEVPAVPGSAGLSAWNGWVRKGGDALGANRMLDGENKTGWPGYFEFEQFELARRFSLGGLLWLAAMGFSLRGLVRKSNPQLMTIAILMGTLTGAIVVGIRWMQHSGLPERFLITPFVAGVVLAAGFLEQLITRKPMVQAAALLLLPWAVIPPVCQALVLVGNRVANPITNAMLEDPFGEALQLIPSGSRILLFGNHQAPDYPLFGPRQGFPNEVFPWGKQKFDGTLLRRRVEEKHITHLLFQDQAALTFEWAPLLPVPEMLQWLSQQPDMPMILSSGHIRMFATRFAGQVKHQVSQEQLQVSEAPIKNPLLIVGKRFEKRLGVDAEHLETPWAIEDLGLPEKGYLWLGTGIEQGIAFRLVSNQNEKVSLELDVEPGPGRTDSKRTVIVESAITHKEICRAVLEKRQTLQCSVDINQGPNPLRVYTPDVRTVAALANGDTRPLIVGLHQVTIEPAGK